MKKQSKTQEQEKIENLKNDYFTQVNTFLDSRISDYHDYNAMQSYFVNNELCAVYHIKLVNFLSVYFINHTIKNKAFLYENADFMQLFYEFKIEQNEDSFLVRYLINYICAAVNYLFQLCITFRDIYSQENI